MNIIVILIIWANSNPPYPVQKQRTAIEGVGECILIKENIDDGDDDDNACDDNDDDKTNERNSKIYLPENMEVKG